MKSVQLLSLAALAASSPIGSIQDYTRLLKARRKSKLTPYKYTTYKC